MRLVVDTNILVTYFWDTSVFHRLLSTGAVTCIAPEYALEEIKKNNKLIRHKSKLSETQFHHAKEELALAVEFISVEEYRAQLRKASRISPDPNDADFFALALKEKIPLWSNDALLKKQHEVLVLSTVDLLSSKNFIRDLGDRET